MDLCLDIYLLELLFLGEILINFHIYVLYLHLHPFIINKYKDTLYLRDFSFWAIFPNKNPPKQINNMYHIYQLFGDP